MQVKLLLFYLYCFIPKVFICRGKNRLDRSLLRGCWGTRKWNGWPLSGSCTNLARISNSLPGQSGLVIGNYCNWLFVNQFNFRMYKCTIYSSHQPQWSSQCLHLLLQAQTLHHQPLHSRTPGEWTYPVQSVHTHSTFRREKSWRMDPPMKYSD